MAVSVALKSTRASRASRSSKRSSFVSSLKSSRPRIQASVRSVGPAAPLYCTPMAVSFQTKLLTVNGIKPIMMRALLATPGSWKSV